jgi:hypothetical protein
MEKKAGNMAVSWFVVMHGLAIGCFYYLKVIVPQYIKMLLSFEMSLPLPTRWIIELARGLRSSFFPVILLYVGAFSLTLVLLIVKEDKRFLARFFRRLSIAFLVFLLLAGLSMEMPGWRMRQAMGRHRDREETYARGIAPALVVAKSNAILQDIDQGIQKIQKDYPELQYYDEYRAVTLGEERDPEGCAGYCPPWRLGKIEYSVLGLTVDFSEWAHDPGMDCAPSPQIEIFAPAMAHYVQVSIARTVSEALVVSLRRIVQQAIDNNT